MESSWLPAVLIGYPIVLLLVFLDAFICGFLGVAASGNRCSYLWGFFFGPFGVLIAAIRGWHVRQDEERSERWRKERRMIERERQREFYRQHPEMEPHRPPPEEILPAYRPRVRRSRFRRRRR